MVDNFFTISLVVKFLILGLFAKNLTSETRGAGYLGQVLLDMCRSLAAQNPLPIIQVYSGVEICAML